MTKELSVIRESGLTQGAANAVGKAVRSSDGATERGYSDALRRSVLDVESQHRNDRDESIHAFTADGVRAYTKQGKGTAVRIDPKRIPQDSVLTHNHPMAIGQRGTEAIGHSFSPEDIKLAIQTNAREMRAVTPTYTYSVKRPEGGWGVSSREFSRVYNQEVAKWREGGERYYRDSIRRGLPESQALARFSVVGTHQIMRNVAARLGWDYTKKKG